MYPGMSEAATIRTALYIPVYTMRTVGGVRAAAVTPSGLRPSYSPVTSGFGLNLVFTEVLSMFTSWV